jgi:sortase A
MTTVVEQEQMPTRTSRGWAVVGVVGELLITLGVLLLLLVAYQLLWTNVTAGRAADEAATALQYSWERPPTNADGTPVEETTTRNPRPKLGEAFALMYIPRLRDKVWGMPVWQSVELSDLARGIGHYPETQMPGKKGNFAVAAHRATNGEPFRDIDRLQVGDSLYVETRDAVYEYTLQEDRIVTPSATWVLDPVPAEPGAKPTRRLITLTTCNPRWASTSRWIWWGELTGTWDKATERVPAAIRGGG